MLHVKSCNLELNSESVFRYFASAVNSNSSTKCNIKDLYAISCVVIQAFKKSVLFLCTPFANLCLVYSDWMGFVSPCIAHQPDGIHPLQIQLIGTRDSPDHRSPV